MRKLGVITALILALVAGCEFGVVERYRYRITVEVNVDGQIKSGAGVIQVVHRPDLVPGRPFRYQSTFSGEAVFVDLGSRGNVIATLDGPGGWNAAYGPMKAFFGHPMSGDHAEQKERFARLRQLSKQHAQAAVPVDQLPIMVSFKDVADRRSMIVLDPRNLEKALGAGVRLKAITIEMTDDPVTTGIEKALPWLAPLPDTSASSGAEMPRVGSFQSVGFR